MTIANSLLDAGMIDLLGLAGEKVTLSGKTILAVVSPVQLSDEWGMGGHNFSKGVTVALRKASVSTRPAIGSLLTYDGTAYQILRIDDEGPGYTLTCSTPVN